MRVGRRVELRRTLYFLPANLHSEHFASFVFVFYRLGRLYDLGHSFTFSLLLICQSLSHLFLYLDFSLFASVCFVLFIVLLYIPCIVSCISQRLAVLQKRLV